MDSNFFQTLKSLEGKQLGPVNIGRDLVNKAMINQWCDAMGDHNPIYSDEKIAKQYGHKGIVAPPAMMQAWVMAPYGFIRDAADTVIFNLLDEAGFTSVIATNYSQEYSQDILIEDEISAITTLENVSEEKPTALGIGHFVTIKLTATNQRKEIVGIALLRLLKFKPGTSRIVMPPAMTKTETTLPVRPYPPTNQDTAFWWDGFKEKKLLIQRCASCQELRHPPQPMCPHCQSIQWDTLTASGKGIIYSYVLVHHPHIPGFDYPLPVALIELAEGTRLVANVIGINESDIKIGLPVQCEFVVFDKELTLPQFRPI